MNLPANVGAPLAGHAPQGSALRVYGRLVRYAWRYKTRLVVSVLFAILIAASFGVMLGGLGLVVNITFYKPPAAGATESKAHQDPAEKIAGDLHKGAQAVKSVTGWEPSWVEDSFRGMVRWMRLDILKTMYTACALVVGLSFFISIIRFFQEYYAGTIAADISTDLSQEMYNNLMLQQMDFFEGRSSGEILARFTNDVFMIEKGLTGVFVKLMREPFKALTFLVAALIADPWLTLVGLCVLPPVFYALVAIGKKMRKSVRRSLEKVASMASVVNETVQGMSIVKSYHMEQYEIGRVSVEMNRLRRFLYQMAKLTALTGPITEFMMILGVALFLIISAKRLDSGALSLGSLVMLYGALAMTFDPLRKLSAVNNMVQTSVASAERVFEFIDLRPTFEEAPNARVLQPLQDCIRFNNVHFSYDGQTEVLRGVDLEIKKGEVLALVGFSGSGKSTLVKLLPRFFDVRQGSVTIDGQDIREVTFKSLREQISLVTQNTVLFAETVRDNIAFGRKNFDDARVRNSAQAAQAEEFIEKLPEGYETILGESGCTLSGGQRQRLAIARAIVKDPAILILDEATSSLDTESERLIQSALDAFVTGRTALVIAHRLSTIQRADRIAVMSEGRVVELGTHEELLRRGGIYRRLYDTQFGVTQEA